MSKYEIDSFYRGAEDLGITLKEEQVQQFIQYYELLVEWNSFMNLTGITEFQEVIRKHFIDSLAIVKGVDLENTESLIDIGTGAGFPGLPIKIVFPHIRVVLLDSLNKRIKFLNEVINQTGLMQVETIHGRAEDFAGKKEYREQFDLSVSRAVANMSTLTEYCLPFVKKNGLFVSYKSMKTEEELQSAQKAIRILGGKVQDVVRFHLMDTEEERSLVLIKKEENTPKKYPRKAGLPAKDPIQ